MAQHSMLGASSLDRRLQCPGSFVLERGAPDKPSRYAAEGTVAHDLAAWCLRDGLPSPLGRLGDKATADGFEFTIDVEMVEAVEEYVRRTVACITSAESSLLVEQVLPVGWLNGEDGAVTTADAVIIEPTRVVVRDLKYGKGKRVIASKTVQPIVYALCALREYDMLIDRDALTEVVVQIDQPRVVPPMTEARFTLAELETAEKLIRDGIAACYEAEASELTNADWSAEYLRPDEDACQFCKAKANCPALSQLVEDTVKAAFEELAPLPAEEAKALLRERTQNHTAEELSRRLAVIDLIEDWCAEQRSLGYETLESDPLAIPGWKLVAGRKGARQWQDVDKAEETLRGFRLPVDDIYDRKVISPTKAEKLLKDSPRRWEKLAVLVTQAEGRPTLARDESPRVALPGIGEQFPLLEEAQGAPADDLC